MAAREDVRQYLENVGTSRDTDRELGITLKKIMYPSASEAHDDIVRWLRRDNETSANLPMCKAVIRGIAPDVPIWCVTWALYALGMRRVVQVFKDSTLRDPSAFLFVSELQHTVSNAQWISSRLFFDFDGFWYSPNKPEIDNFSRFRSRQIAEIIVLGPM